MSKFAVGTCRALAYTFGPQIVVCHRCRKFVGMPALDVPYGKGRSLGNDRPSVRACLCVGYRSLGCVGASMSGLGAAGRLMTINEVDINTVPKLALVRARISRSSRPNRNRHPNFRDMQRWQSGSF